MKQDSCLIQLLILIGDNFCNIVFLVPLLFTKFASRHQPAEYYVHHQDSGQSKNTGLHTDTG